MYRIVIKFVDSGREWRSDTFDVALDAIEEAGLMMKMPLVRYECLEKQQNGEWVRFAVHKP